MHEGGGPLHFPLARQERLVSPLKLKPSVQVKLQREPKAKGSTASRQVMLPITGNETVEHFFTVDMETKPNKCQTHPRPTQRWMNTQGDQMSCFLFPKK